MSHKNRDRLNTHLMRDSKCPFMQEIRGRTVLCEGPTGDATVALRFRTMRKMEAHAAIYCTENYKYCEIYRMVMAAKYED